MHDPGPVILSLLAGGSLLLIGETRLRLPGRVGGSLAVAVFVAAGGWFLASVAAVPGDHSPLLPVIVGRLSESAVWLALAAGGVLAAAEGVASGRRRGATFGFLLLACAGTVVCAAAATAWEVWLGLELVAVAGLPRREGERGSGGEGEIAAIAAEREWRLGLLAALLFAIGLAMSPGSLTPAGAGSEWPPADSPAASASTAFLIASLGLRVMAAPFHLGDRLAAGPPLQIAWFAVLGRAAPFLVWLRLLAFGPAASTAGAVMTGILSAASLGMGLVLLAGETHLGRSLRSLLLLQTGGVLAAIAAATWSTALPEARLPDGLAPLVMGAATVSFWADAWTTLGWRLALQAVASPARPADHLDDLRGLGRTQPLAAGLATLFVLGLGGWPPLPTFWGRMLMVAAAGSVRREALLDGPPALHPGFLVLIVLLLAGWIAAARYSLRLLDAIWLRGPLGRHEVTGGRGLLGLAAILAVASLLAGLLPGRAFDALTPVEVIRPAVPRPGGPSGRPRQRVSLGQPFGRDAPQTITVCPRPPWETS